MSTSRPPAVSTPPSPLLRIAEPLLGEAERRYLLAALEAGEVSSQGRFVREFESRFAAYARAEHGVATSSGTTALHAAVAAFGVGPGDEVIVPPMTFVGTANAVAYCGARPRFADIHPGYWGIAPEAVGAAVTARTRGIIVVHLYGHPVDLDPILATARARGLWVLEDAAEAHGATYKGRPVGALADASVFSFYANKVITTGEGGIVLTNDADFAHRVRHLRDHAMDPARRYWHTEIGFNYRMTNLQAAVGLGQMERIDEFVARKREIRRWYEEALAGVAGLTPIREQVWAGPTCWLYTLALDESRGWDRARLASQLRDAGVETRPCFVPLHQLPMYREEDGRYPVSERIGRTGLSLPSGVSLTQADVERVAGLIRRCAPAEGGAA
jgi:perosamine synthetase